MYMYFKCTEINNPNSLNANITTLFLARPFFTLNYDNCNIPQHFCDCPKQGHGFLTLYIVVLLLMFNELKSDVIGRFIDIGETVDLYCFNFLFINYTKCFMVLQIYIKY